ncbi:MAG: transglycosylase SLT domain-containing protein [Methylococcales bacterium]|nr:transglycosylase SLT domain-containing protein [Methylococcales bacterium]
MMKNNFLMRGFLVICLLLTALPISALSLTEQREAFFNAEKLLKKGNETEFLIAKRGLRDYALYPYLHYHYLKTHLDKDKEIQLYLTAYNKSRYANLLRRYWLVSMAKKGQWTKFIANYQPSKKQSLQCYYHLAQYKTGETNLALKAAKGLWLSPTSLPKACNPLFSIFEKSSEYTQDLIWERFKIALRKGKKKNIALANYLAKTMSGSAKKSAQLWLKVYNKPMIITNPKKWNTEDAKAGDIFSQGIYRLSRKHLELAISTWDRYQKEFKMTTESADYAKKRLGLVLAYRGKPSRAYRYLSDLTNPDAEARQWRIRVALRKQNWPLVSESLANLTDDEKKEEKWRYWLARTLEKTKEYEHANSIYTELAKERSYYGFASADKVQAAYQLNDKPIVLTNMALANLKQRPEFKMIKELFALNRTKEAKWDWWFSVKNMNNEDIKTAAKLAQEWGMVQTAVFTVAKAKYWDDMDLRFPLLFKEQIKHHAKNQNLKPAMVFGLIRQESVFNELAGSQVGARGLMQIMPATGRQIARELGVKWRSASSLYEAETNLKFGTYYYKKQLDKFDNQAALAAAGYNAGPHRVKKWRPKEPMAMDIWIETIPFDETRKYVSVVLANIIIYQQRLKDSGLKMQDFLSKVQPS